MKTRRGRDLRMRPTELDRHASLFVKVSLGSCKVFGRKGRSIRGEQDKGGTAKGKEERTLDVVDGDLDGLADQLLSKEPCDQNPKARESVFRIRYHGKRGNRATHSFPSLAHQASLTSPTLGARKLDS